MYIQSKAEKVLKYYIFSKYSDSSDFIPRSLTYLGIYYLMNILVISIPVLHSALTISNIGKTLSEIK